jgi:hypothetical protein
LPVKFLKLKVSDLFFTTPIMAYNFIFPIRIVQAVLAIVVLGLLAYGRHVLLGKRLID